MKKTLFSLAILTVAVLAINAQQLQNAGFETWTGGKPNDWKTLEIAYNTGTIFGTVTLPVASAAITQSASAHTGNYSLQVAASSMNPQLVSLLSLVSAVYPEYVSLLDSLSRYPVPGLATNGTIDALGLLSGIGTIFSGSSIDIDALSGLADYITDGLTVSAKPYTIAGFVKPTIQNADDACIVSAVVFSNDGGSRHAIGAGATTFLTSVNEFQPFSAPITYLSPNENASELIVILISLTTIQTTTYTSFLVDDLTVDYTPPTAVNAPKTAFARIYHNKADNTLNIFPENTSETYSFELYNILGKRVIVKNNFAGNQRFNLSALSAGCYIVKAGGTTQKIIIR